MRTRTTLVSVLAVLAGAALCLAADVNMGVWKVNGAKSTFGEGAMKGETVTYEAAGDSVKVIVEGTDKAGKKWRNEWVGKYDGKDYPVTGDASYDSRGYTKADDSTMNLVIKKGGKVVANGTIAVALDGKSRTVTIKSTDPKATALNQSAVYDKQ